MGKEVLQGSVNHFGPRETAKGVPSAVDHDVVRVLRAVIKVNPVDGGLNLRLDDPFVVGAEETYIPAHSVILDAKLFVKEAFTRAASGTSGINIGLAQKDGGGVLDADAFFDGSDETVFANIDAANWWINGEGSSIGVYELASPVTEDAVLSAAGVTASSNDLTGGEAVVLIRYIPPTV